MNRSPKTLPIPAQQLFALLRGETAANIQWDDVGVYAVALGLGPLLLENTVLAPPPVLATRLKLSMRRTNARTTALLDALHTLLGACATNDVPILVLKGAYLAPAVYGNLGLRGMSDIDLLVQPHDFSKLQDVFAVLGYEGKYTSAASGPGIVKHEWTYKLGGDSDAAANPYFGGEGYHVEPHTSLAESWFGLNVDITPGVWEHATAWAFTNSRGEEQAGLAMRAEDNLLHGAVHLIFHLLMGKPAFLQLYDIRRLLESFPNIDFSEIVARARASAALPHLLAALHLAIAAYAAPVPSAWLRDLSALCSPSQRAQATALQLEDMWALTQQAPLTTLRQRLRRGIDDRALAAAWARDRAEAWRVWRSALLFYRTDTASILKHRLTS